MYRGANWEVLTPNTEQEEDLVERIKRCNPVKMVGEDPVVETTQICNKESVNPDEMEDKVDKITDDLDLD